MRKNTKQKIYGFGFAIIGLLEIVRHALRLTDHSMAWGLLGLITGCALIFIGYLYLCKKIKVP